jgi:hypothetical protein
VITTLAYRNHIATSSARQPSFFLHQAVKEAQSLVGLAVFLVSSLLTLSACLLLAMATSGLVSANAAGRNELLAIVAVDTVLGAELDFLRVVLLHQVVFLDEAMNLFQVENILAASRRKEFLVFE